MIEDVGTYLKVEEAKKRTCAFIDRPCSADACMAWKVGTEMVPKDESAGNGLVRRVLVQVKTDSGSCRRLHVRT